MLEAEMKFRRKWTELPQHGLYKRITEKKIRIKGIKTDSRISAPKELVIYSHDAGGEEGG